MRCRVGIVSSFYDGNSFKERENLRVSRWPISLFDFSFIFARYILLRLKTLNSRNFKSVSQILVFFYLTAITTDNVECLG